jgi:4-amino-4-deoxy-L-arabinose transferase-like glycosyltransferase
MNPVPSTGDVFPNSAKIAVWRLSATWPVLAPAAIVLLGFAVRLYNLTESVGLDEAFSMAATRVPVAEMWSRVVEDFVHPPLHYFALRGWLDVFGYRVWTARMLSVLFGTLAIPLLYLVARDLFGRGTALLASLMLAVSQIGIMYAQEARPYAQFQFVFVACWFVFIRALRSRSALYWCGFICLSILLIYTHYFGLLVFGALALFAIFYRKEFPIPAAWWLAGGVMMLLAYVPWLTSGIFAAAAQSGRTFSGKNAFWSVNSSTFFTAINFFSNGKPAGLMGSSPIWTFPAGCLLFSGPAVLALSKARQREQRPELVLTAMLLVLPILGAIAAGLLHFQYNVRYVAFCAAPFYVLVGRGISALRPSLLRVSFVVALLAYTGNSLRANYFVPTREDFRAAGSYIDRNRLPGDCAAFFPGMSIPVQWSIEHPAASLRILDKDDFTSDLSSCDRVWAIARSTRGNPWQWERARIEQQGFEITHRKSSEQRFLWVHVALYLRKQQ